jgi:hypothetical protein
MSSSCFVFRAPDSKEELRQLLRLRYCIYRESSLRTVTPHNKSEIDVDWYDVCALHFGLYQSTGINPEPVGYLRIVRDASTVERNNSDVLAIADECPETLDRVHAKQGDPFPLMAYFPGAGAVTFLYNERSSRGETFVEPGRLSLQPSVRSISMVTFVTSCAFAIGHIENVDEAILSCDSKHVPFYRRFGFDRVAGAIDAFAPKIGLTISALIGSPKRLTERYHEEAMIMAESYRTRNAICYRAGSRKTLSVVTQMRAPVYVGRRYP